MRKTLMLLLLVASTSSVAQGARPAADAKPGVGAAAAAAPSGPRVVPYEALEGQVGKSIVIKTNMRTTRRGTLKRFNRAGLLLTDTSRGFAMDIDIPRSTVKEVTVVN